VRPALGVFAHEMAGVDDARHQIYLSEDQPDGLFYRYTAPPGVWGSGAALDGGVLEAMSVAADGKVTWLPVPNAAAPTAPLRASVPGATAFDGGEGIAVDGDRVYLTTKNDDRVWVHDIAAQTMTVLYDATEFASPTLNGVDNIIVSKARDLYVAEDGGNMEINIITPDLVVAPVVRLPGPEHGFENGTAVPTVSEVSGIGFSPDGNRMYLVSSRAFVFGVTYEVTGPFRGGTLAAQAPSGASAPSAPGPTPAPAPTTAAPTSRPPRGGELARTGGTGLLWPAAAAAALWRLQRRVNPPRT
jgi:secreted PhoX family phosphatase